MDNPPDVSGIRITPLEHVAYRDQILSLCKQGDEALLEAGRLCNLLEDHEMWKEAGYRTFRAYMNKELGAIPRTTLDRYRQLARAFPKETVMKYGVDAMEKLLTYHELVGQAPLPEDPGPYPVEVPGKGGAGPQEVRFADCTPTQIEAAIRAKRQPKEPVPEEQQKVITQLQEACDAVGETGEVKVSVKVEKGTTFLTVGRIPFELLEQVADLMKAAAESEKAAPKQAA